jgi:hypothetical protein
MDENEIESILKQIASKGKLLGALTDKEIDAMLTNSPEIKLSDRFKRDARSAMWLAHVERKSTPTESDHDA